MPTRRVFISFKAEYEGMLKGLRLLAKNLNYDLEFIDESVRVPINSVQAPYIRSRIREKISRSGVVLYLVNTDTYTSKWVAWELETAIELKKPIVAMAVKGDHASRTREKEYAPCPPSNHTSLRAHLWEQFEALLPERKTNHPLGCHLRRISDRVVFEKLVLGFWCSGALAGGSPNARTPRGTTPTRRKSSCGVPRGAGG